MPGTPWPGLRGSREGQKIREEAEGVPQKAEEAEEPRRPVLSAVSHPGRFLHPRLHWWTHLLTNYLFQIATLVGAITVLFLLISAVIPSTILSLQTT